MAYVWTNNDMLEIIGAKAISPLSTPSDTWHVAIPQQCSGWPIEKCSYKMQCCTSLQLLSFEQGLNRTEKLWATMIYISNYVQSKYFDKTAQLCGPKTYTWVFLTVNN